MNFSEACESFRHRIEQWRALPPPPANGPSIGVLVLPWMFTAVPHFSLEVACFCRSAGMNVTLLWDSVCLSPDEHGYHREEARQIAALLEHCKDLFLVVDIANAAPSDAQLDAKIFDDVIFEAAVQRHYGERAAREDLLRNPGASFRYIEHARRIRTAVANLDRLWIPGGFFGTTFIYTLIARQSGLAFTTYDCTLRGLWYCQNGIAGWSETLPPAFRAMLPEMTPQDWRAVEDSCSEVMEERRRGDDFHRLQVVPAGAERSDVDVLICLNWRVDTAALLRQKLFPTIEDWLEKVALWAVVNRRRLVIRRHPGERLEGYYTTDDYAALARSVDPSGEFVTVVEARDPVNTYDLMRPAKVVLPYTSQIGIEAAFLGKPVLLGSHCFYAECDFAWAPESQDEYFSLLTKACDGGLTVDDAAKRRAMLCYYIFQHGMEMVTDFRPLLECYDQWSVVAPMELWREEQTAGVRDLLLRPDESCTRKLALAKMRSSEAQIDAASPRAA